LSILSNGMVLPVGVVTTALAEPAASRCSNVSEKNQENSRCGSLISKFKTFHELTPCLCA